MLPRKLSSSDLATPDSSVALRSPENHGQDSNLTSSISKTSPDLPWKQRTHHDLRPRVYERSPSASARSLSTAPSRLHHDEPRQIILDSFAPRIACFASTDTEQFVISKGFSDGLCGLLRPFGERIQGKVVIRDSVGASRGWEDFGIRFVNSILVEQPQLQPEGDESNDVLEEYNQQYSDIDNPIIAINKFLEICLTSECDLQSLQYPSRGLALDSEKLPRMSNYAFSLYLRKLLSSMPIVPYETFAHPVACIIAVSSRNPSPIDSLRQLYERSGQGARESPSWISSEYLRYYVLIHDEENDDITKSTALFDLMKRHFGLHCHLLRLRGSHCVQTDDDSVVVPRCEWLSAGEELAQIRKKGMLVCSRIALLASLPFKIFLTILRLMKNTFMNLMQMPSKVFSEKW